MNSDRSHFGGPMALGPAAEEALLSDVPACIWVVDRDGSVLRRNSKSGQLLLGHAPRDTVTLAEYLAPACMDEWLNEVRACLDTGHPVRIMGLQCGVFTTTTFRRCQWPALTSAVCLIVCAHPSARPHHAADDGSIMTSRIARTHDLGPLARLTARELELLMLITQGLSSAEIAAKLHRSIKTVEWHRGSVGAKLNARNRVDLALVGARAGLEALPPDVLHELIQTLDQHRRPAPTSQSRDSNGSLRQIAPQEAVTEALCAK